MRRPLLLLCSQLVPPGRQESLAQVSTFSHLSEEDYFAPRFYFDLSCLSHQEWRASHAISHHLHTNSLTDVEVDVNNRKQKLSFLDIGSEPNWQVTAVEPFLSFLPESKNLLQVSFFSPSGIISWKLELAGTGQKSPINSLHSGEHDCWPFGQCNFALFLRLRRIRK